MSTRAYPFLMFTGQAEAAMRLYVSVFSGQIDELTHWGAAQPGKENTVMRARFTAAGQTVLCSDSPVAHGFSFTPSFSFFVDCTSEAELEHAAAVLGEGGKVLMPLDNYGFSRRFTWLSDRFGVSWQLNLP